MERKMKIRTRTQDDMIEVQVLVEHPMETGLRKDKASQKIIPAHFIQQMSLYLNGKLALETDLGISVSQDPLVGFRLPQAKNGDKIKVSWRDNRGETGDIETVVEG